MNEVFAKCVNFSRKIRTEGSTSRPEVADIKTDLKASRVGGCGLGVTRTLVDLRLLSWCS